MRRKINLYLDDLRDCPKDFEVARNVNVAKKLFEDYDIGILSLDHDLGEDENGLLPTGYDFVKYFCEYGLYAESIYIHTANPVGRENMYKTLKAAQRNGFISSTIKIYNRYM